MPEPGLSAETAAVTPAAFTVRHKDIEQNHLCLAWPSLSYNSPDRYAQQVLSNILGGGMSSRLFQEVRETRGLCYSIYSFAAGHADAGLFGIYTALSREAEKTALPLIMQVIRSFLQNGPSQDELTRAREQVKANVLMGLESLSVRMNHFGRNELLLNEVKEQSEVVACYDAVTCEDIRTLAQSTLRPETLCFSAVGRTSRASDYRNLLLS